MMRDENRTKIRILFMLLLLLALVCFYAGILKNNAFNKAEHKVQLTGDDLFNSERTYLLLQG